MNTNAHLFERFLPKPTRIELPGSMFEQARQSNGHRSGGRVHRECRGHIALVDAVWTTWGYVDETTCAVDIRDKAWHVAPL